MPRQDLISRKTDLKSLKYGSAGPYIEKDINNPPQYNALGAEVIHRFDDLKRITKMLVDTPGLKWALHQAELNFAYNEKKGFGKRLLNTLGDTAKVIGSTLAQVPVSGTGVHFVLGFGGAEYLKTGEVSKSKLLQFLKTTSGVGGINGASAVLNGQKVIPENRGQEGYRALTDTQFTDDLKFVDATTVEVDKTYIKLDAKVLAKQGGKIIPDNTGDAGFKPLATGIDRDKQETKVDTNKDYLQQDGRLLVKGSQGVKGNTVIPTRIEDDTKKVVEKYDLNTEALKANNSTIEKGQIAVYNPPKKRGKEDAFQKSAKKLDPQGTNETVHTPSADQENKLEPYLKGEHEVKSGTRFAIKVVTGAIETKWQGKTTDPNKKSPARKIAGYTEKEAKEDEMIPFTFAIMTPDTVNNPTPIHFFAYLDSMNDNYNASWNGQRFVGRGESFYNYGGFERKSTIGFKVAGRNYEELEKYYKRLNALASVTAPTYDSTNTFMRGSYIRMTVGSYFVNQPAIVNSVGLTWDVTVPWEIDDSKLQVPHVLNVNLDTTVLHDFSPYAQPAEASAGGLYFGKLK